MSPRTSGRRAVSLGAMLRSSSSNWQRCRSSMRPNGGSRRRVRQRFRCLRAMRAAYCAPKKLFDTCFWSKIWYFPWKIARKRGSRHSTWQEEDAARRRQEEQRLEELRRKQLEATQGRQMKAMGALMGKSAKGAADGAFSGSEGAFSALFAGFQGVFGGFWEVLRWRRTALPVHGGLGTVPEPCATGKGGATVGAGAE